MKSDPCSLQEFVKFIKRDKILDMLALPLSVVSIKMHIAEKLIVGAWRSSNDSVHQVGTNLLKVTDTYWLPEQLPSMVILISLGGRSPRAVSVFGHQAQKIQQTLL